MAATVGTTGSLKRYLFEQGFHVAAAAGPASAAAASVHSAEELAAVRNAAFAEGRASGLAEAGRAAEARLAAALEAVGEAMAGAAAASAAARAAAIGEAIATATAITAKLLPALYRREAASEIEAVVAAVLPGLLAETGIVVRVNPADRPAVAERLLKTAERAGLDGRLTIKADDAVAAGDCRVEWSAGGAERDGARLWQDIHGVLAETVPLIATLPPAAMLRLAAADDQPGLAAPSAAALATDDVNRAGGNDVG